MLCTAIAVWTFNRASVNEARSISVAWLQIVVFFFRIYLRRRCGLNSFADRLEQDTKSRTCR